MQAAKPHTCNILLVLSLVMFLSLVVPSVVLAEELDKIFTKVNEYIEKKNYAKALEELGWAQKEIEKLHSEGLKTYFPDQLSGLTGDKFEVSAALGLKNVERKYADAQTAVSISLVGGGKSAGGALGGFAGLGRMAAMMQQGQPGMDQFRLNGFTANLDETGNKPEISVFLKSGGIVKIQGIKNADGGKLKTVGEALDLAGLDKYLNGDV